LHDEFGFIWGKLTEILIYQRAPLLEDANAQISSGGMVSRPIIEV